MPDKEKVIRGITYEILTSKICHRHFVSVDIDTISDALELLKEQEAVVRCLDCKFAELCEIAYRFGEKDDWFCADGKRKEGR